MLSARGVTKRYGPLLALDAIDLDVRPGEVFGLLGSNGAGKTTLMKIFATLLRPDAGSAAVRGLDVLGDPLGVRRLIGFVPETPALYDKLTGREFLHMIARLRGMPDAQAARGIQELSDLLRMEEELDRETDGLSRGMKQKVALASAMFHRPPVLILDEPTNGLDPRFARLLKGWLRAYAAAGNTVLLSTHVTQVAEAICDRIAVVHGGRVAALGTPEDVSHRAGTENLEDAFSVIVEAA
ncbi:MAG TPA: ABC transporter ATP-binding protein [Thermoplasmata archaeon]|nr:ABC transporter ATP-binding protein [Thermoplasmata archaeon]